MLDTVPDTTKLSGGLWVEVQEHVFTRRGEDFPVPGYASVNITERKVYC